MRPDAQSLRSTRVRDITIRSNTTQICVRTHPQHIVLSLANRLRLRLEQNVQQLLLSACALKLCGHLHIDRHHAGRRRKLNPRSQPQLLFRRQRDALPSAIGDVRAAPDDVNDAR